MEHSRTLIKVIICSHEIEFKEEIIEFYDQLKTSHNFSIPRTPKQNRVIKRKNKNLEWMAKIMLCKNEHPKCFYAEAVNTINCVLNICLIKLTLKKTTYELFKMKNPKASYFRAFGCKCFIHDNGKENLVKLDARSNESITT